MTFLQPGPQGGKSSGVKHNNGERLYSAPPSFARLAAVQCTISPTNGATVRATTRVGSHPLSRVTGTDFVWTGHSSERLVQCCTATINAGVTQYVVVTTYFVGVGEDR